MGKGKGYITQLTKLNLSLTLTNQFSYLFLMDFSFGNLFQLGLILKSKDWKSLKGLKIEYINHKNTSAQISYNIYSCRYRTNSIIQGHISIGKHDRYLL